MSLGKLFCLFLLILLGGLSFFWRLSAPGKYFLVESVTDGDTIKLADGRRIRYLGLDSPEEEECYYQEAKKANQQLVLGKKVRLEFDLSVYDRFGRQLAYVFVQEENGAEIFVNRSLLKEGLAVFFLDTVNQRYRSSFIDTANQAHQDKEGLWRSCAPDKLTGCIIKGNYDRRGHRWYHLPDFRHYNQTVVNLQNGDQWFCTEDEAIAAGFTRARE